MKCLYQSLTLLVLLLSGLRMNAQSIPTVWKKYGVRNHYDILSKDFARVYNENKSGVINIKGDTIIEAKYTSIFYDTLGYFIVSNDENIFGVINRNMQFVLPCKYEEAKIIDNGIQAILDGSVIYYDLNGKVLQHPIYSKYLVQKRNKTAIIASIDSENWGVINDDEKWLIPPRYSYYFDIRNPNFIIYRDGVSYVIANTTGKVIGNGEYNKVDAFGEYYYVEDAESRLYYIFDKNGKKWEDSLTFNKITVQGDLVFASFDGSMDLYDTKMNLKMQSEGISLVDENSMLLSAGAHEYKALYNSFEKVTDNKYRDFYKTGDTIVAVGSNGIDLLNQKGKIMRTFGPNIAIADDMRFFMASGGQVSDTIYFIKQNGFVKTYPFTYISSEHPNYFETRNYGKSSLYKNSGEILVKDADRIDFAKRQYPYYTFSVNNNVGIVTPKFTSKPIYEEVNTFDGDMFFVSKFNEWSILNNDGSRYNNDTYTKVIQVNKAMLLKKNTDYVYLDIKTKSLKNLGKIVDYIAGMPNDMAALKIENIGWKLYQAKADTFLSYVFDSLSYNPPFMTTNLGVYRYDHYRKSFDKVPSNYITNPNNQMITLNNGVYTVELYNYRKKVKTYVKQFKCDSLEISFDYLTTFTKGLKSIYSIQLDDYIVKDADFAKIHNNELIFTKHDSIFLHTGTKKILSIKGEKPSILIPRKLISYYKGTVKYVYDLKLGKEIPSKYDIYKNTAKGFYIVENNLKFGLVDANYNEIIHPIYDNLELFYNKDYFIAYVGPQSCLLDFNGNICIPLDGYYGSSFTYSRGLVFAKKDDHYGIYNTKEKKWYPASKYQDIKDCNVRINGVGSVFIFRENGHYGLMDEKCVTLVSPEYDEINVYDNLLLLNKSNMIRYFNANTKTISNEYYNRIEYLKDFVVGIKNDSICIFTKKMKLSCTIVGEFYQSNYGRNQVIYSLKGNGGKGVYDADKCKITLAPKYHHITEFGRSNFVVQDMYSKTSIISSDGKVLFEGRSSKDSNLFDNSPKTASDSIAFQFKEIIKHYQPIGYDWLKISNGSRFGIVDANGVLKIPMIYDDFDITTSYDTYNFNFKRGTFVDVYSRSFELICKVEFDYVGQFRQGLAPVRKGFKWGYIDTKGKVVIPLNFDYCDEFNGQNRAIVISNGIFKSISEIGVLGDFSSKYLFDFSSKDASKLIVESGNYNKVNFNKVSCHGEGRFYSSTVLGCHDKSTLKWGLYDFFYNEILPNIYDDLYDAGSERIIYSLSSKFGLMDLSGKRITEPIYDKLFYQYEPTLKASKDGHSFLIDLNGKVIE